MYNNKQKMNMKVVIFAGGFGTRLSEATNLIPKPIVEIREKPIFWHIYENGYTKCESYSNVYY